MKANVSKIATFVFASGSFMNVSAVDMLTYYPNGETATAPFLWNTAENWQTGVTFPARTDGMP